MTFVVVTVGNAPTGWDALIASADALAGSIQAIGVAQIGGSDFQPQNLRAEKFVPAERLQRLLRRADIVITHGGIGSIGDCLRMARRFVVVPRSADPSMAIGNQVPVAQRLGEMYEFPVVELPALEACVADVLRQPPRLPAMPTTNVPEVIRAFMEDQTGPGTYGGHSRSSRLTLSSAGSAHRNRSSG